MGTSKNVIKNAIYESETHKHPYPREGMTSDESNATEVNVRSLNEKSARIQEGSRPFYRTHVKKLKSIQVSMNQGICTENILHCRNPLGN